MHLAEFNIGTLRYDWDDPRVADFADNLGRVYAIAERSPGYVWHMDPDDMDLAQNDPTGVLGGDPRTASTLSVWESPEHLRAFSFDTVHKQFYDRRGEWYDATAQKGPRLVMWWVPVGHLPAISEAAERLQRLMQRGETEDAFGWTYLQVPPT